MKKFKFLVVILLAWLGLSIPAYSCDPATDPKCKDVSSGVSEGAAPVPPSTAKNVSVPILAPAAPPSAIPQAPGRFHHAAVRPGADQPLLPVRQYLAARDIPPAGAGAYGLVVLQSKPTPTSRPKLMMVCQSFLAHFPRSETADVPAADQMVTVWPVSDPEANELKNDDCNYAMDHYDLVASEQAISDAEKQNARFEGEGPYLVGWSPSKARGVADALILVIDMSADNSQQSIDRDFLFWKDKIVENPSLWRNGWSAEAVRSAIKDFSDQYGTAVLEAIKLIGGGDKKG